MRIIGLVLLFLILLSLGFFGGRCGARLWLGSNIRLSNSSTSSSCILFDSLIENVGDEVVSGHGLHLLLDLTLHLISLLSLHLLLHLLLLVASGLGSLPVPSVRHGATIALNQVCCTEVLLLLLLLLLGVLLLLIGVLLLLVLILVVLVLLLLLAACCLLVLRLLLLLVLLLPP